MLWNVINNILRKSSNKSDIVELQCNGRKATEKCEICEVFNNHFATAGQKVKDSIVSTSNKVAVDYVKQVSDVLLFSPVSELYINNIVLKMKSKRSSGYDEISNMLLKQLISVINLPLCIVINKSLFNGEFPDLMKLAKVIPLHKGGLKNIPDNYRPISLLPMLSKVLERVVYN